MIFGLNKLPEMEYFGTNITGMVKNIIEGYNPEFELVSVGENEIEPFGHIKMILKIESQFDFNIINQYFIDIRKRISRKEDDLSIFNDETVTFCMMVSSVTKGIFKFSNGLTKYLMYPISLDTRKDKIIVEFKFTCSVIKNFDWDKIKFFEGSFIPETIENPPQTQQTEISIEGLGLLGKMTPEKVEIYKKNTTFKNSTNEDLRIIIEYEENGIRVDVVDVETHYNQSKIDLLREDLNKECMTIRKDNSITIERSLWFENPSHVTKLLNDFNELNTKIFSLPFDSKSDDKLIADFARDNISEWLQTITRIESILTGKEVNK